MTDGGDKGENTGRRTWRQHRDMTRMRGRDRARDMTDRRGSQTTKQKYQTKEAGT